MVERKDRVTPKTGIRRRGILFRTIMLSSIVIILSLGIFVAAIIPYSTHCLMDHLESTTKLIASSIGLVSTSAIITEDYSAVIDHCMEAIKKNPAILYVVITRRDGFSLVNTAKGWTQQELGGFWRPLLNDEAKRKFVKSELVGREVLHYSHSLGYSGIDWGWIHIGHSLEKYKADLRTVYLWTTGLAMFSVSVGLILSFFFARRLSKPVLLLNQVTQSFGDGDLSARVKISSGDELENLANSFNNMAETIQGSQKRFQDIAENTEEWIWEIDESGRYTYTNQIVEKVLGYKPEEVIDKYFYDFFHPDNREELKAQISKEFAKRQAFRDRLHQKVKKDGRVVFVETSALPMFDNGGNFLGYRGVDRDVTERKEAERQIRHVAWELKKSNEQLRESAVQLVQAEKLSGIGELTASVAHELNQPLNVTKIICQSILKDIEKDRFNQKSAIQDLPEIIAQIKRMAEIIDHMRVFSRRTEGNIEEKTNLNIVVENALTFLKQQLKAHNITLIKNLAPDLPDIKADSIRLEQVFMNLITNARHALENSKEEERRIEIKTYSNNDMSAVVVEIKDNGPGMPQDVRDKIFESFFTTKEAGKGTGLGLSLANKIIEEHSGKIEVESKLGEGSTFKVILPLTI